MFVELLAVIAPPSKFVLAWERGESPAGTCSGLGGGEGGGEGRCGG